MLQHWASEGYVFVLLIDTILHLVLPAGSKRRYYDIICTYGRRQKKFSFTVRTTGRVILFRFRSRLISVRLPFLSVFKPLPFCPKGSPSVLVNGPDGLIKHARSLIALEGSRQFSGSDRARARAT